MKVSWTGLVRFVRLVIVECEGKASRQFGRKTEMVMQYGVGKSGFKG